MKREENTHAHNTHKEVFKSDNHEDIVIMDEPSKKVIFDQRPNGVQRTTDSNSLSNVIPSEERNTSTFHASQILKIEIKVTHVSAH